MLSRKVLQILGVCSLALALGILLLDSNQDNDPNRTRFLYQNANSSSDRFNNGTNGTPKVSQVKVANDIAWSVLEEQILQQYENIFGSEIRIDGHINTDKVIYRPNDVMFIEVMIVETFNKTPLALSDLQQFFIQLEFFLEIHDPAGNTLYQSNAQAQNSTISFTSKLPQDIAGGQYLIKVFNNQMSPAVRVINIRTYNRQELIVSAQFNKESYFPGDTVNGIIKISMPDESPLQSEPTYSFDVQFDSVSFTQQNLMASLNGTGSFSFVIPSNVTRLVNTISFNVNYESVVQIYSTSLIVGNSQIVIDFSPETNLFVYNVPNKIYFQAWTNDARSDVVDFQNASLKSQLILPPIYIQTMMNSGINPNSVPYFPIPTKKNNSEDIILASQIRTLHRGKGMFNFTPKPYYNYYLEINLGSNNTQRIYLNQYTIYSLSYRSPFNEGSPTKQISMPIYINSNEVSFTISNTDKILEQNEDLMLQFSTNNQVQPFLQPSQQLRYIVTIQEKEQILYAQVLKFDSSSSSQMTIKSTDFELINGGILQVNLYEINPSIVPYISTKGKNYSSSDVQTMLSNFAPMWLYDKGEILFFKKPSSFVNVNVTTDKDQYKPGDQVNFTVQVQQVNASTIQTKTQKVFVSVFVTDESVFGFVPQKNQPPSLPSMIYLENDVQRYNYMFYYANEYLNQWYNLNAMNANDMNLDLLLGIQSWRYGYFFYPQVIQWENQMDSLNDTNKTMIQNLFGYAFPSRIMYFNMAGGVAVPMAGAAQGSGSASGTGSAENTSGSGQSSPPSSSNTQPLPQQLQQFLNSLQSNDFMLNISSNTRMYSHQLRQNQSEGIQVDMTETLYYQTAIPIMIDPVTNRGSFQDSFYLSDLITQFRISANAFDANGALGFQSIDINSQVSFYLNFNMPPAMVAGDMIDIPVNVFNNLDQSVNVIIGVQVNQQLISFSSQNGQFNLQVNANSTQTLTIVLTALKMQQQIPVTIFANGNDSAGNPVFYSKTSYINIVPKGFQMIQSQGGFIGEGLGLRNVSSSANFTFLIPNTSEPKSISFEGKIFSSNYATLVEAVASLIKEPYGCFEQLSATTYPLVMGLQFLQTLPDQTQDIQDYISKSTQILQSGYQKLVGYKTKENGYEWFGESPASEVLSAYGLMQFLEMSETTQGIVDPTMLNDLMAWLNTRKNGQGGFSLSSQALDSFGRAPQNVTDAYIVWALTSSSQTTIDLTQEINALVVLANQSISDQNIDTYYLSLIAAILYNVNRTQEAQRFADVVAQFQNGFGKVTNSFFTITMSQGLNLDTETTAIATIAWLNDVDRYFDNIDKAIIYIISVIQLGQYGTTQSTILSLKAITKYMNSSISINGDGDFTLLVNNEIVQRISFTKDTKSAIIFDIQDYIDAHSTDIFRPGQEVMFTIAIENYTQNVTLENEFSNDQSLGFKLSYSMNAEYYDQQPPSGNTSISYEIQALNNQSQLGSSQTMGQIYSYNLTITNTNQIAGLLMVVAVFRVPACLDVNFDQLNRLKENNLIDYYEVLNSNTEIVLYWRQFMAAEQKVVTLDLVQVFEGKCYEQPSSAYVYYDSDQPIYWIF